MRRLVIAVDCDDVLVRTTPYFVSAYNQKYGTNVPLNDAHIMSEELWGADTEEVVRRIGDLVFTDEYKALGTSPEETEVLKELSKHHDLHLVTARKEEERETTKAMLDRDLPGVFTSLDLVGWQGSKGEVCKRIGADVLIDDNARHLHNAIEHGLPKNGAILFGDYPWNKVDSTHQDLTYCLDWFSVQKVIENLAND